MPNGLSNQLVGIAGVHHAVSELSRRGLIALPTVRNLAAYDVLVATADGKRHANLQVKTSSKRVPFFPMPPLEKIRTGRHDWYVLLRWLDKEQRFEGFMLSGKQARAGVARGIGTQANRRYESIFPALQVGPKAGSRAEAWRETWRTWTP
jgi:hypothetical protein